MRTAPHAMLVRPSASEVTEERSECFSVVNKHQPNFRIEQYAKYQGRTPVVQQSSRSTLRAE
jgi:hypothetical protein